MFGPRNFIFLFAKDMVASLFSITYYSGNNVKIPARHATGKGQGNDSDISDLYYLHWEGRTYGFVVGKGSALFPLGEQDLRLRSGKRIKISPNIYIESYLHRKRSIISIIQTWEQDIEPCILAMASLARQLPSYISHSTHCRLSFLPFCQAHSPRCSNGAVKAVTQHYHHDVGLAHMSGLWRLQCICRLVCMCSVRLDDTFGP